MTKVHVVTGFQFHKVIIVGGTGKSCEFGIQFSTYPFGYVIFRYPFQISSNSPISANQLTQLPAKIEFCSAKLPPIR